MTLYTRIFLIVFALLLLTIGTLSPVVILSARQDIIDTSQRDLEATATLLASMDSYLLSSTDQDITHNAVLQQLVDDLTRRGDIAFIRVVNQYHSALATSSNPLPGYEGLLDNTDWQFIARAQNDNKAKSELIGAIQRGGILRAAAPVTDAQGRSRGAVFVRQSTDRLRNATNIGLARSVAVAVLALVLSILVSIPLARSITRPIQQLSEAAQALARGEWQHKIQPSHLREIDALGRAFTSMTGQLKEIYAGLEERVAERTHEVERRAEQIATGAEISHAASQELDPGKLLPTVVDLIRERFDLYYVAVFLIDESGRNAVLRAGTGEAGQTMLERGHKLEVGSRSMVGWVCANKKARIALDVGDEPIRFANPLLPFTRSEIALPLRAGERIIGALDIQSTRPQAFDQNDITALQGMADQIAVALENAHLFQQVQSSLQEIAQVNRLLTGQSWQYFLLTRPADFAEFHQPGLLPVKPEEADDLLISGAADQARRVCVPLRVRDETIGSLVVERTPDQPEWTDAERTLLEAISAQASQAMDSIRLFEESQRLAARERAIGQVAARIRETLDVDTVIKVAAQETRLALNLPEIVVRLVPPAQPVPGNGRGESKEARQ